MYTRNLHLIFINKLRAIKLFLVDSIISNTLNRLLTQPVSFTIQYWFFFFFLHYGCSLTVARKPPQKMKLSMHEKHSMLVLRTEKLYYKYGMQANPMKDKRWLFHRLQGETSKKVIYSLNNRIPRFTDCCYWGRSRYRVGKGREGDFSAAELNQTH